MKRKRLSRSDFNYYISKGVDFLGQFRAKPVLLISGFYRSGTTWVQEVAADALNAKTIFEPLSASNKPPYLKSKDISTPELYFPTNESHFSNDNIRFLDRAFHGFSPYSFSYVARYDAKDAFRQNVVVKVVRGHFILQYLSKKYNVPVIHIRRHPCAVINSFMYTQWSWTFDDVKFKDVYPNIPQLHAFDDAENFEKIAAFWAYTENLVKPTNNLHILSYEDLVMNDMQSVFEIIGHTSDNTEIASAVSSKGRENLDKQERLTSWKKTLTQEQQTRIYEITETIAPELMASIER